MVSTKDSNLPEVIEYSAGIITEVDPVKAPNARIHVSLEEERNEFRANARRLVS